MTNSVDLSLLVDLSMLVALIVGIAGTLKALGMNNKIGAWISLVTTLLSLYALAYLYHTYYGLSTPLMNAVLSSGKLLADPLLNIASAGKITTAPQLIEHPFSNSLLNDLYFIGVLTYTTIIALSLVFVSILVSIIRFIVNAVRRRR